MSTYARGINKFRKLEKRTRLLRETYVDTTNRRNVLAAILASLMGAVLTWAEEVTPSHFFHSGMITPKAIKYFFEDIKDCFKDPVEMKHARKELVPIRSNGDHWKQFKIEFEPVCWRAQVAIKGPGVRPNTDAPDL